MSKYLIINADDFGVSHAANAAAAELYASGKITSVSLMAGAHAYDEAVRLVEEIGITSVGVHLYLTSEYQDEDCIFKLYGLTKSDKLLCNGIFPPKFELSDGILPDVRREVVSQIEAAVNSGIKISHLDNHMYSLWPGRKNDFFEEACLLCVKYGIPSIRLCAKIDEQDKYYSPVYSGRLNRMYARTVAGSYSLKTADYVFLMKQGKNADFSDDSMLRNFRDFLSRIPNGITELHFHPAIPDDEMKLHNPWWKERAAEYNLFKNNDIKLVCGEYGIKLISYADIAARARHTMPCAGIMKNILKNII
ncbi:MAG: ChbG/HpnK family deacetylase [Clostridia bacterium]|nr:ChbG/HpnK family deacetylase [Clostridia bacterium]